MINNNLKSMNVMMKKWILFMFAFAGLAFAACSGDDVIDEGGGGVDGPSTEGEAWLALRINKTSGTRAWTGEQNGTVDESQVNSARALLFSSALKLVKDGNVDLSGPSLGLPGQPPSGAGGAAFKVDRNAKYVLIIVNPQSGKFSTFSEGADYSTVTAAISATVDDVTKGTGGNRDNFMMTNAKGYLEPSYVTGDAEVGSGKEVGDLKELNLYASASLAESSPLVVNVDRVAAKVRVYTANDIKTSNTNATIGDINWLLNVTNKKYFPVSERTQTWNEGATSLQVPPTVGGVGGVPSPLGYRTPYDIYKKGSYRIDPNYNSTNIGEWNATNTTAYVENYSAYGTTSPLVQPASGDWSDIGTAQYCLENTQVSEYNEHAYTTQAIIRAQYAPKNLKNEDGSSVTDIAASDPWFRIGSNGYYTLTSLGTYIKKELEFKYKDKNVEPSTVPAVLTNAFNTFLETNNPGASGSTKVVIPETWADFINEYDKIVVDGDVDADEITAGIADLVSKFTTGQTLVAGTTGSVSYYDGGYNYYKIMIKHDNVDDTNVATGEQYVLNELGEFGVVRNSVYDVTVSMIMNPGYPVIPDPEEKDDEDDEMYLAVKININPWTWYTQTEPL